MFEKKWHDVAKSLMVLRLLSLRVLSRFYHEKMYKRQEMKVQDLVGKRYAARKETSELGQEKLVTTVEPVD